MSAGHHSNNGDKRNGFALARRPSSAVEKAAPRAKRIVSGMVADTLALANQSKAPKPRGKLLIVDDQCEVRDLLRVIFEDKYDLLLAEDGATAIELAKQHDVDVVVTNIHMARMDGLELLERLKLLKPDIKVIILTGHEDAEFIRQALRLRAFDYLNKPCDMVTIRSAVSKAMQHRKLESERTAARKKSGGSRDKVANLTPFKRRGLLLIVNDEDGPRQSLRVIFKEEYDLLIAEDGLTAIELAQEHPIDVVLLDIRMAGMSGIEVLERLKLLKPDIEVIMMTAFETTDTMLQSLRLGACDYINCPFDIATIRSAVRKAMRLSHGDNSSREVLNKSEAESLPVNTDTELEYWYRTGQKYYCGQGVAEDYTKAVKWYRMAAEKNHADAQNALGVCYHNGDGVSQDYAEALKWYRRAAEQGHMRAQHNLGDFYYSGVGIAQDYTEAAKWFRKAAEQGHFAAQFELAECYSQGEGVAPNAGEAVKWYRKAAEQGFANAQHKVGICFLLGMGVAQDEHEALNWFNKSARQGNSDTTCFLGEFYMEGLGTVQKDFSESYKWLSLAIEQGDKRAVKGLKTVRTWMSPQELLEGERRIREFNAQKFKNGK